MLVVIMPTKLSVMNAQTTKSAPLVIVPAAKRVRMKSAEFQAEVC